MPWKDWIMNEWRRLLGEHDDSMTSHAARQDPVDLKIKKLESRTDPVDLAIRELERRTSATERLILDLYETERNTITLSKRKRKERHR